MPGPNPLQGCRILLVEDESFVSMLIEDMLLELGAGSVETAMRLEEAERAAREKAVDIAVLDVNLAGRRSYPVAEVLKERGIPFLFATGYGSVGHDAGWRGSPTLKKPFETRDLQRALEEVIAQGRA
jgi:CheY-like chemotaxis protein